MTTNEFKSLLHDLMVSPGSGIMKRLEEAFEYLQQVRIGLLEHSDKLRAERDMFKRCMDDELLRRQSLGARVTELEEKVSLERKERDLAVECIMKQRDEARRLYVDATRQRDELSHAARGAKEKADLLERQVNHLAARTQELSETRITASEAQHLRTQVNNLSRGMDVLHLRHQKLQEKLTKVKDILDPRTTASDCCFSKPPEDFYGTTPEAQR